jgi:hypothetical protein
VRTVPNIEVVLFVDRVDWVVANQSNGGISLGVCCSVHVLVGFCLSLIKRSLPALVKVIHCFCDLRRSQVRSPPYGDIVWHLCSNWEGFLLIVEQHQGVIASCPGWNFNASRSNIYPWPAFPRSHLSPCIVLANFLCTKPRKVTRSQRRSPFCAGCVKKAEYPLSESVSGAAGSRGERQ